jgi:hypothetical protein
VRVLQRAAAGQRGGVHPLDRQRRRRGRRGGLLQRLRLRQHRVGQHVPGGADPAGRAAGRARRPAGGPSQRSAYRPRSPPAPRPGRGCRSR